MQERLRERCERQPAKDVVAGQAVVLLHRHQCWHGLQRQLHIQDLPPPQHLLEVEEVAKSIGEP